MRANRNSFQAKNEYEDRGGGNADRKQRQGHFSEYGERPVAVDMRGLLQLDRHAAHERAHDPDGQRQVEDGVEQDQRQQRVVDADEANEEEDRDRDGDGWHHPLAQNEERQILAPAEAVPLQAIGRERADTDREYGADDAGDQAVHDPGHQVALEDNDVVLVGDLFGPEDRAGGRDRGLGTDARDEHPVERKQHDEPEYGEDDVRQDAPDRPLCPLLGGVRHRDVDVGVPQLEVTRRRRGFGHRGFSSGAAIVMRLHTEELLSETLEQDHRGDHHGNQQDPGDRGAVA